MLSTFHITNSNNNTTDTSTHKAQLNVSECLNGKKVILGTDAGEKYAEIIKNLKTYAACGTRWNYQKIKQSNLH